MPDQQHSPLKVNLWADAKSKFGMVQYVN